MLLAVWDALKEAGIDVPFPHRRLIIDQPRSRYGQAWSSQAGRVTGIGQTERSAVFGSMQNQ
ncbi:MAG: hypothetical protein R3F54_02530 [Alphaproteobacteria bacterium]